jgi:hypothetical protein
VHVHGEVEPLGLHPREELLDLLSRTPSVETGSSGVGDEAVYVS